MIYNIIALSVLVWTGSANVPASSVDVKKQFGGMKVGENCDLFNELHFNSTEDKANIETNDRKVHYWLFTRKNPKEPQNIIFGDANSVHNSNYDGSRSLNVVVHGWNSGGDSFTNAWVTESFLAVMDVNVIVVDWFTQAHNWYDSSVKAVPKVGQNLGDFLQWLINLAGGDWDRVHLIGHSLGSHVVGNAGRQVGGKAARLTGLDPAAPMWESNPNALRKSDAQYVEIIHTDGGYLGKWNPIGHADFYPDGGTPPQPGCPSLICDHLCSHIRAYLLFAASVRHDQFAGYLCEDLKEAEKMQCHGKTLNMGNGVLPKRGNGTYGLRTTARWPYILS